MNSVVDVMKSLIVPFIGTKQARKDFRQHRKSRSVMESVEVLQREVADNTIGDHEQPIFVLSAGWRSGSTLVQRLLMSDQNTLVWGEVYDRSNIVQNLAKTILPFTESWPPEGYLRANGDRAALSGQWVANLYPSLSTLRNSYRALLRTLLADSALELGATRWGMKEVRFGVDEAAFLRWIFPQCKIVFVYRNPYDAYLSYKKYSPGLSWYASWPNSMVATPRAFGRHWQEKVEGFLTYASALNAHVVQYEQLVTEAEIAQQLGEYCELRIDANTLRSRVGSGGAERELGMVELSLLRLTIGSHASSLGYEGPS